ncbi:unnamed protein product, partial [marine sediment metagenome]
LQNKFYNVTVIETAKFFGLPPMEFAADGYIDNNKLDTADMEFELIPSPGHSPDSICFYCQKDRLLICGDVIFAGNTGRVDLPGGNADELRHSIEELSQLEISYLLPGHMDIVTSGEKVKSNFDFIKRSVLRWL